MLAADRTIGAPGPALEVDNPEGFEMRSCGDAGPFSVFDTSYRGLTTPVHVHGWASIHWVLSGSVEERYAGAPRVARSGDMLLYAPGVEHQTRVSRDARIIHLPLSAQRSPDCGGARASIDPALFVEALAVACHALVDQAHPLAERRDDLGGRLADSLARRDHVQRRQGGDEASRIGVLLARGPSSPRLSGVARRMGLSRSQAARFVRATWGCSVGELDRARQIMRATRLLLAAESSLADIADACGFSDQSHFGRAFRERVGLSPGAFRRLFSAGSA